MAELTTDEGMMQGAGRRENGGASATSGERGQDNGGHLFIFFLDTGTLSEKIVKWLNLYGPYKCFWPD
jgi:hypothetical protein